MRWSTAPFGLVCRVQQGQVDPLDARYSSLPLIGPEHIESGTGRLAELVSAEEQGAISGKYICEAGGVIYSKIRPRLRKVAIAPTRCLVSADAYPLLPGPDLEPRFLRYYLLSEPFSHAAVAESERVAMPKLNRETLASMRMPVPPLEVQRRIADYLDTETARIDTLITKNDEAVGLLEERVSAASNQAFSGGSEVRHGWAVPDDWPLRPLSSLSRSMFSDGDWVESPYITDEGVRLIQTGNIGVGHYREQGYRYISADSFDELACTEVLPGDVLICRLAEPIGRACAAPDLGVRMITSVDVTILRCDLDARPEFVVEALSSPPWLAKMAAEGQGGTRSRIARLRLGEMRVPVPNAQTQQRVVSWLAEARSSASAAIDRLTRQRALLAERRQALITAAVTGEIEV